MGFGGVCPKGNVVENSINHHPDPDLETCNEDYFDNDIPRDFETKSNYTKRRKRKDSSQQQQQKQQPCSKRTQKAGSLSYTVTSFSPTNPYYKWLTKSSSSLSHANKNELKYHAIVTCFFLDTATSVLDYIYLIYNLLYVDDKERNTSHTTTSGDYSNDENNNGIWINVGPLQWHANTILPLSVNELKKIIISTGMFDILHWSVDDTTSQPVSYRNDNFSTNNHDDDNDDDDTSFTDSDKATDDDFNHLNDCHRDDGPNHENKPNNPSAGLIPIDSIYTPIKNVQYSIENYRVEQKTDYEKLIINIVTDGSIHPKEALKEAAKILIYHFMLFSDEKITLDSEDKKSEEEFDETSLHMRQLLKTKLAVLAVPSFIRTKNPCPVPIVPLKPLGPEVVAVPLNVI